MTENIKALRYRIERHNPLTPTLVLVFLSALLGLGAEYLPQLGSVSTYAYHAAVWIFRATLVLMAVYEVYVWASAMRGPSRAIRLMYWGRLIVMAAVIGAMAWAEWA